MPGVTYTRDVEFTPRGPVVIHVVRAPKPGGPWSLRPVLSNGAVVGRETLTEMQRRLSAGATLAGVNGDRLDPTNGGPDGIFMREGVLATPPNGTRASIGIDASGVLQLDRIRAISTWQGRGPRRSVRLNDLPATNGVAVFTAAWGPATPALPGAAVAVVDPLPGVKPGGEPSGPVVALTQGGAATAIPPTGAVVVARGTTAAQLAAEAPVGQQVTIRVVLEPDWSTIPDAIGGGPVLVRNRRPLFRTDESFAPAQLVTRTARTAVGQTANGGILLVAVDGSLPGYSVGLTNFELAQTLARLGAVSAAALGSGDDTTLAFDGGLLNRPSNKNGERPITDALVVAYEGAYAPLPAFSVLSPNGDGLGDRQALAYKLVRRSTVTARLVGPDGASRLTDTGIREPGIYRFPWPGTRADGRPEAEGRWAWTVSATDDIGRSSQARRPFFLNNTLGFLQTTPVFRIGRNPLVARFTLTRAATVSAYVESANGVVLRRFARRSFRAGTRSVSWNGLVRRRPALYPGRYVVRVVAQNALGRSELTGAVNARA